jgi:hypothetical protein
MDSKELRSIRDKLGDPSLFWVSENVAQLAELNENLVRIIDILTKSQLSNAPAPVARHGKRPLPKDPALARAEKNARARAKRREGALRDKRRFYAVEYVPSLPPKIDQIYDRKPDVGVIWHHVIVAHDKKDAELKLIARLTKEREEEQDHAANAKDDAA